MPEDHDLTDGDETRAAPAPTPRKLETAAASAPRVSSGSTIGPYRLLKRLGEGGMGEVWLAQQEEPLRRRVALKIIKAGLDTKEVVARFEAERQALAMMDHPSIAKVFEAGQTHNGRPYFAMEYVQGVPITDHCDTHKLTVRQRLELFRKVCEAVQHAHQKALIHRDLKPSNILVSILDTVAVPKIIDFGVAKATAQRLTERTLYTELGVLIGTPEYMSPEQAEVTAQDIDTRTDVYSLGVVLYELLVGALPFSSKELRRAGFLEIQRVIREDEPPRPSTRVSTLGDEATISARVRRTEPRALSRQLRGDLDWITMKALDKDRMRRYSSAEALGDDIGRYLGDQPIVARPPSALYRGKKFFRRHTVGIAFTATITAAILAFAANSTFQAARLARERDRAELEAEKAEAVSRFLRDTLSKSDPFGEAGKADLTVREALDQAVQTIDGSFAEQPIVGAAVRHTIGEAYLELGLLERSEQLLQAAYRQRQEQFGDDPEGGHPELAQSLEGLATLRWKQYRDEEADELATRAVAMRKALHGPSHPAVAEAIGLHGNIAVNLDYDRGVGYLREALDLYDELGIEDNRTASVLQSLGFVLDEKDPEESENLLRRSIEIWRHTYGPDHPMTLYYGELILAERIHVWGRAREAQQLMEPLVDPLRSKLGERFELADLLRVLGKTFLDTEEPERATPLLEEAAAIYRQVGGEETFQSIDARSALAQAWCESGGESDALQLFGELAHFTAATDKRSALGGHGLVRLRYAECLAGMGRPEDARRNLVEITEPEYEARKQSALERLAR